MAKGFKLRLARQSYALKERGLKLGHWMDVLQNSRGGSGSGRRSDSSGSQLNPFVSNYETFYYKLGSMGWKILGAISTVLGSVQSSIHPFESFVHPEAESKSSEILLISIEHHLIVTQSAPSLMILLMEEKAQMVSAFNTFSNQRPPTRPPSSSVCLSIH